MSSSVDPNLVRFEAPELQVLSGKEARHYYTQRLTYNNSILCLQTDIFEGVGLRYSNPQKPEMLIRMNETLRKTILTLQDEAIKHLKFPEEFKVEDGKKKDYFKLISPNCGTIFAKLTPETQVYDPKCQPFPKEALSFGNYRVIIHIPGIYIGPHGNTSNLASLQFKVLQIQYLPIIKPCMFTPMTPDEANVAYDKIIEPMETNKTETKKKGRKPKLQRQNAMPVVDIDFDSLI